MSEADNSQTREEEGTDSPDLDASFTVDSSTLSSDESEFAKQMGFGGGAGNQGASGEPQSAAPTAEATPAADEPAEVPAEESPPDEQAGAAVEDAEAVTNDDEAVAATAADPDEDDPANGDSEVDAAAPDKSENWEEIQPRTAADGMQETLQERADELLERPARTPAADARVALPPAIDEGELAALRSELASAEQRCGGLQEELAERDAELLQLREEAGDPTDAEHEKLREQLSSDLETLGSERDQLIDQLATTSGQLVQAQDRVEQLEVSLKAARGALTPLPEGERALRTEVIGLRTRLDEAHEDNAALMSELSTQATDLAIALARVEDRQHEVDVHVERASELEAAVAQRDGQLDEALAQHREILAVSTRLQAENNELRSTQAALEETLQARDLEISAREEHLTVTRQGLTLRDAQLIDANEQLEQEKHRGDALEAELQRRQLDIDQLHARVERRESRIATLAETLKRVEEAMGQGIGGSESPLSSLPQAEWSQPAPGLASELPAPETRAQASTQPETQPGDEGMREDEIREDPCEPAAQSETEDEVDAAAPADRLLMKSLSAPPILSTWRDRRFDEVTGDLPTSSVHAFLAERLHAQLGDSSPECIDVKSLGGSLPDAEVRLVKALQALGDGPIRVEVIDFDEERADERRRRVELAGLGETIEVRVADLDEWAVDAPCHAILLSDALHGQPEVGRVLDHFSAALSNGALLLFVGRIGVGGIRLSASTLSQLEELWSVLPESLSQTEDIRNVPRQDEDCGLPVDDADPASSLLERFEPLVVAGFGHLADLVVGPARGFAMSAEDDDAMQLLESIMAIDESRALSEDLAPRHGVAVFAASGADPTERFGQAWPGEPEVD